MFCTWDFVFLWKKFIVCVFVSFFSSSFSPTSYLCLLIILLKVWYFEKNWSNHWNVSNQSEVFQKNLKSSLKQRQKKIWIDLFFGNITSPHLLRYYLPISKWPSLNSMSDMFWIHQLVPLIKLLFVPIFN